MLSKIPIINIYYITYAQKYSKLKLLKNFKDLITILMELNMELLLIAKENDMLEILEIFKLGRMELQNLILKMPWFLYKVNDPSLDVPW